VAYPDVFGRQSASLENPIKRSGEGLYQARFARAPESRPVIGGPSLQGWEAKRLARPRRAMVGASVARSSAPRVGATEQVCGPFANHAAWRLSIAADQRWHNGGVSNSQLVNTTNP
jgi:hypothetical protein